MIVADAAGTGGDVVIGVADPWQGEIQCAQA